MLRDFFSPFMKPLEKDYLYLFMLIIIALSSGLTSLFYKNIFVILLAILISSALSIFAYCLIKNLKKENLRDNMSDLELVLNMLAEATTTELTKAHNPIIIRVAWVIS